MRALLARHVRLAGCRATVPTRALNATPTRLRPILRQLGSRTFERSIFGVLFEKPPREVREPEYEPGWLKIMMWRSNMLENLRPPNKNRLLKGWNDLMSYKSKNSMPLNTTQAMQCQRLLVYLTKDVGDEDPKLKWHHLDNARKALLLVEPVERGPEYLMLAETLLEEMEYGGYSWPSAFDDKMFLSWRVLSMCLYGDPVKAAEELYTNWDSPAYHKFIKEQRLPELVAKTLADGGHEHELLKLLGFVDSKKVLYTPDMQQVVVSYFATRNRVPETQYWYTRPVVYNPNKPSSLKVIRDVAAFAARNNLHDWAKTVILEKVDKINQAKLQHLLPAVLALGYRLDDARSLISNLSLSKGNTLKPDVYAINSLLRVAAEKADQDLASEVLEFAKEFDVRHNEETCVILMSLYVALGDPPQVQAAFERHKHADSILNPEDSKPVWNEYRKLVDQYLRLLCRQRPTDLALILRLLQTVQDEKVFLYPETVEALCLRLLENEQHFDVMDVLSIHAFGYSDKQRQVVQNAFLNFCLDPDTSTSRSWHAYQLLQQYFQDLDLDRRTQLMHAFFNRKRPDMATHVFGHMRQHRNKDYHPKADTYIACLEEFSKYPDLEGVNLVHNMLKMDTRMQPDRRLYTALMLAYTGCDKALTALEFWDDIKMSEEGPSYDSLAAVFWALQKKPSGGAQEARELWEQLEAMDVEIPASVYNSYIGAIAGGGSVTAVQNLIIRMASIVGTSPDILTLVYNHTLFLARFTDKNHRLGTAYNALPGQELQKQFQEWAEVSYPETWAELLKKGRRVTEARLCHFRIDRGLKA